MATVFKQIKNNAKSLTNNNVLNNTTTSMTMAVENGSSFPVIDGGNPNPFYVTAWNVSRYFDPSDDPNMRIGLVTARSGNNLDVTWGQLGTPVNAMKGRPFVALLVIDQIIKDIYTAVNAAENDIDALETRGINPEIIVGATGNAGYRTDGVNDEVQIQAAIDALNAANGGIVRLQPGAFNIANPVILKSNVTVAGSGMGITIVNSSVGTLSWSFIAAGSGTTKTVRKNIYMRDLTIASLTNNHSALISNTTNAGFERVEAYHTIWNAQIRESLVLQHCENGYFYDNWIHDVTGNGVQVNSSDYVHVRGNKIDNFYTNVAQSGTVHMDDGIDIDEDFLDTHTIPSRYIVVEDNVITGSTNGNNIRIASSQYVTCTNNISKDHTCTAAASILVNSYSGAGHPDTHHINVDSNHIIGGTDSGIKVLETTPSLIYDINVRNNTLDNVGNTAPGGQIGAGIALIAPNVVCTGNILKNCGKNSTDAGAILIYKRNGHTIRRNRIFNSPGAAIRFWNGDGLQTYSGVDFTNNEMYNNLTYVVNAQLNATSRPPIYNVKEFGVLGDGSTDDKTYLQNVINMIPAGGSGTLDVPDGVFMIGSALSFGTRKITLRGRGMGDSIIRATPTFSGFAMIYDYTAGINGIELDGLTFDTNNVNGKGVMEMGTCSNVYIHDCELTGVASPSASHWTVLIGAINNADIAGSASYNVVFTNNYVHDNSNGTNETILPINVRNSRFDNNYFLNNTNSAYTLNLFGYCYDTSVSNNIFRNSRYNIYILSCDTITVANNIAYADNLNQDHIAISNSQNVTVNGNICHGYRSAGSATGGINVRDRSGTFDGHAQLYSFSRYINITNNQLYNCYAGITVGVDGAGIYDANQGQDIIISNNQIFASEWSPIIIGRNISTVNIQNIMIENNYLGVPNMFDTGSIQIIGDSTTPDITKVKNVTIRNNKILPSTRSNAIGIYLSACSGVSVYGNDLEGTGKGTFAGQDLAVVNGATTRQVRNNFGVNPDAPFAQGNVTGATTFNRAKGNLITATLTGNITAALTNGFGIGDRLILQLIQDATGSRTATWPSNFKKAGGSLVLSTAPNAVDTITAEWDGTNWNEVARALNLS